jgi:hypothetical protein
MSAVVAEQELFRACQVIFGNELNVSRDFLAYVQMSGVKRAYRKRAKETHPDCFVGQGDLAQRFGARKFQVVQNAYKNLTHYVNAREKGYRFPCSLSQAQSMCKSGMAVKKRSCRPASTAFSQKKKTSAASRSSQWAKTTRASSRKTNFFDSKALFKGALPDRAMLFGHFLYYSGLVDWQTIVRALIWQRASRPRVGDIGVRFGWLARKDILTILKSGNCTDAFGRKAVAGGKLSRYQMQAILAFQKKSHRRIGEYFLKKRIFTRMQLQGLLRKCHEHNIQYEKLRCKASGF